MHRPLIRPVFTLMLLLGLGLVLATVGCQGPDYINIPAEQGDLASNNPNDQTPRQIMARAVHGLIVHQSLPRPVALALPRGSTALTTADVARRAGKGVVPAHKGMKTALTLQVRAVRVRADKAQVDVVVPGPGGVPHLTTVHLAWAPFGGWKFDHTHVWQGSAREMLRGEQ